MNGSLRGLGENALAIRRTRVVIQAVVLTVIGVAVVVGLRRMWDIVFPWWPVVAVVVLTTGWGWWWAGLDHSRWGWRFTEDLLEVQSGVLVRNTALVPRSRIQNVTTTAGPLQTRLGLVTLSVHTAGARTRSVSIQDIDVGHAESIRRQLGLA